MFSKLRKRFTYANVIMTLALVFAMTGGAYAAKKYLITSTKQISPKVLKRLKGVEGPAGPQGAQGPQGAASAAGKDGVNGKDGLPGVEGKSGPQGKEGKQGSQGIQGLEGKAGSPWTAGGILPSGATETGSFAGDSLTSALGVVRTDVPISFSIPLAEELDKEHVIVIYEKETVPIACENAAHAEAASALNPEASSGYLCIYLVSDTSESTSRHVYLTGSANTIEGASTAGAYLDLAGGEAGWPFHGTWAVTG